MSLTFPRSMPALGPARQVFEPQRVDYETATSGGRSYGVAAGLPRWRAEWTLANALTDVQSDEWRAFVASLKGAGREFYGRDVERPYPRAYRTGFGGLTRAGGGTFDGTATSWSQTIASDGQCLLTLNGLPASFQISMGDYVAFRWTTSSQPRRALVRALEAGTANGSGVLASLSVEPAIPSVVPGGAVAFLDNPECVMRLVTGETELSAMDRRRAVGGKIVALQVLLP